MNYEEINWKPLFAWLNEVLGIGTNASFSINLEGKKPKINCHSPLFENAGIFKAVISKVEVGFFNFGEIKNDEGVVTGFWATPNLFYESWTRGSNGMEIGNVWYDLKTGWKFESSRVNSAKY